MILNICFFIVADAICLFLFCFNFTLGNYIESCYISRSYLTRCIIWKKSFNLCAYKLNLFFKIFFLYFWFCLNGYNQQFNVVQWAVMHIQVLHTHLKKKKRKKSTSEKKRTQNIQMVNKIVVVYANKLPFLPLHSFFFYFTRFVLILLFI